MTRDLANNTTRSATRLRWLRILGGAVLLELVLFIALVPPLVMLGPDTVVPYVYPACLIFGFGVTWWILRKVQDRPVMHGTLIGIVATAIYILLALPSPGGIQSVITMYGVTGFIAGNALRIIGCIAGGYARLNRSRN